MTQKFLEDLIKQHQQAGGYPKTSQYDDIYDNDYFKKYIEELQRQEEKRRLSEDKFEEEFEEAKRKLFDLYTELINLVDEV